MKMIGPEVKYMNIGILGYGTVGRNVHKLLGAVDGVSVKYVLEQPG